MRINDTSHWFSQPARHRLLGGHFHGALWRVALAPGGERWLFWPMRVPEPGAQRQWVRHATAFVGRRHFDDPALLERHVTLGN